MKNKPAKYIVTMGPFDDQTNNIKIGRKVLKNHVNRMFEVYGSRETYGLYMLVETRKIGDK